MMSKMMAFLLIGSNVVIGILNIFIGIPIISLVNLFASAYVLHVYLDTNS